MPRVMGLFAKLGLVPSQVHCAVVGPAADELAIDVQVPGLDAAERANIARGLGRIVEVTTVLTTEKRIAA